MKDINSNMNNKQSTVTSLPDRGGAEDGVHSSVHMCYHLNMYLLVIR